MKLLSTLLRYCEDIDNSKKLYSKYKSSSKRLLGTLDYLEDFSVLPGKVKVYTQAYNTYVKTVSSLLKDNVDYVSNTNLDSLSTQLRKYLLPLSSLVLFVSREFLDYVSDEESANSVELKRKNREDLEKLTLLVFQAHEVATYVTTELSKFLLQDSTKYNTLKELQAEVTKRTADLYERDGTAERLFPLLSKTYYLNYPPVAPLLGRNPVLRTVAQDVRNQNADLRSDLWYFYYHNGRYSVLNYESDTNVTPTLYDFVARRTRNTDEYTPVRALCTNYRLEEQLDDELSNKNSLLYTLYNVSGDKSQYDEVTYEPNNVNFVTAKFKNVTPKEVTRGGKLGTLLFT